MRLSNSRQIHPLTFEVHSGWHHIIRLMGHMARSQHQHRIKVYTTQVFRSMIMRGVDLNMTLAGPGRSGRRSGCSGWGGFAVGVSGCLCRWRAGPLFDRFGGHGRVWVRAIGMRPPSVAPSLDRVAAVRLGRGHHGGHSGVSPGSSCSRTRGRAGWNGFSSGERVGPSMCFRCWVVLVRVAGGMVVRAMQPGGVLGSLPWFACPRWRVATCFGAWSRFWRPRVDRPGHGETAATGAIVFTAWRAISWRGDPAGLVGCDARGVGRGRSGRSSP